MALQRLGYGSSQGSSPSCNTGQNSQSHDGKGAGSDRDSANQRDNESQMTQLRPENGRASRNSVVSDDSNATRSNNESGAEEGKKAEESDEGSGCSKNGSPS